MSDEEHSPIDQPTARLAATSGPVEVDADPLSAMTVGSTFHPPSRLQLTR